jgi:ABC-type Zn2+ transport system substrate-binding protein/surface adhesin
MQTHVLTYSLTYTHTHNHNHSLSHTHTHTLTRTQTHTHTSTHTQAHTHRHTHTHTHTHAHTRTCSSQLSRKQRWPAWRWPPPRAAPSYSQEMRGRIWDGPGSRNAFMCSEQRRLKSVKVMTTALAAGCCAPARLLSHHLGWKVMAANLCFSSGELIDCIISLRSSGCFVSLDVCF